jgi:hypothetical protein
LLLRGAVPRFRPEVDMNKARPLGKNTQHQRELYHVDEKVIPALRRAVEASEPKDIEFRTAVLNAIQELTETVNGLVDHANGLSVT